MFDLAAALGLPPLPSVNGFEERIFSPLVQEFSSAGEWTPVRALGGALAASGDVVAASRARTLARSGQNARGRIAGIRPREVSTWAWISAAG
jgi:hypothetical protein